MIDVSRTFRDIPGVVEVRVGEVIPSDRKIVDDSFDIGIIFSFKSVDDMNSYIQHPTHLQAVKDTLIPLTHKILVYDFIE